MERAANKIGGVAVSQLREAEIGVLAQILRLLNFLIGLGAAHCHRRTSRVGL